MEKKIFGNSEKENIILDRSKARDIVGVILDYGVSQDQIKQIIKLLALELENNDLLKKIINIIDDNKEITHQNSILTGE